MKASNPWLWIPTEIGSQFVYDIIIRQSPTDGREDVMEEDVGNSSDVLDSTIIKPYIEDLRLLGGGFLKSPILDRMVSLNIGWCIDDAFYSSPVVLDTNSITELVEVLYSNIRREVMLFKFQLAWNVGNRVHPLPAEVIRRWCPYYRVDDSFVAYLIAEELQEGLLKSDDPDWIREYMADLFETCGQVKFPRDYLNEIE